MVLMRNCPCAPPSPLLLVIRLSKEFNYDCVVMVGDGATDMQVKAYTFFNLGYPPPCVLLVSFYVG